METMQKKKKKDFGEKIFIISMLIIPIISFLIFYVIINFNSILMAFQVPLFDGRGGYKWGLGNFQLIIDKFSAPGVADNLGICVRNSIIYFCLDMFIMFPLSLIICYFIYKKIAGYTMLRTIIYLPVIITAPIMVTLYRGMIDPGGILHMIGDKIDKIGLSLPDSFVNNSDHSLKTILIYMLYTGIGGRFVLLGGAMNAIDSGVIDAGKIDGAGPYRELVSIIMPCIAPTLSTMVLLGSVGILMASGPSLLFDQGRFGTQSINYFIYSITISGGDSSASTEMAAAIGVISTLVSLPIAIVVLKITRLTEE